MTVAVVACSEAIGTDIPQFPEGVMVVGDLCSRPARLGDVIDGADTLVLVVHPRDVELSRLQAAVRQAGFDPFGVPLVDVAGVAGTAERFDVIIAGASARGAAFRGSRPEQARPVMSEKMSRRALLTIPRPFYEAVPAIDQTLCAAADGCRACVELCPRSAYRSVGRRIEFHKDSCITCGLCVTACPTGAIETPSLSAVGLRAEIEAIVAASVTAGIVFTCASSTVPVTTAGWFGISVPCAGMVPGTWLVAAVLLGAAAATIRPCRESGCPIGHDERADAAVSFGRELAVAGGLDASVVPDVPGTLPVKRTGPPVPLTDPFGVHGAAEVAVALAASSEAVEVEAPVSPLGIIDIDRDACTLCTMCAETCPTGALEHGYADGMMTLSFDAGLCTACAQCVPMCPERERGAITLRYRTDAAAIAAGRVVAHETRTVSCESCGRPIAPAATLDRIAGLLGDEHADTARYLATRCMDCRGLTGAMSGRPVL